MDCRPYGCTLLIFLFLLKDANMDEYLRFYHPWYKWVVLANKCVKLQPFRINCERFSPICRQTNCNTDCPCPGPVCTRDCPCSCPNCPDPSVCPPTCPDTCPLPADHCLSCPATCSDTCPLPVDHCSSCPATCSDTCPLPADHCTSCPVSTCSDTCPPTPAICQKCATEQLDCSRQCPNCCLPPNTQYTFCKDAAGTTDSGTIAAGTKIGSNPMCTFTISVPGKKVTATCITDKSGIAASDGITGDKIVITGNPNPVVIMNANSLSLTVKEGVTCSWISV